jgi:predicted ATPase
MSRLDLERIRDWAIAKLSREKELRRTVHEYTKVRETAESILAAMDVAKSKAALSPTPNSAQTARLRLVWSRPEASSNVHCSHKAAVTAPR